MYKIKVYIFFPKSFWIPNIISQDFLSLSVVIISILLFLTSPLPSTPLVWQFSEYKEKVLFQLMPEEGGRMAVNTAVGSKTHKKQTWLWHGLQEWNRFQDTIVAGQQCIWSNHNPENNLRNRCPSHLALELPHARNSLCTAMFHPTKIQTENSLHLSLYFRVSVYRTLFTSLLFEPYSLAP